MYSDSEGTILSYGPMIMALESIQNGISGCFGGPSRQRRRLRLWGSLDGAERDAWSKLQY